EDHDRSLRISIDTEMVSAAHGQEAVVVAVEVDDALPTLNPPGIARHGDDVLEDDIVCQQVEVVLAIGETFEPFSNDEEEGSIGSEIRAVLGVLRHVLSRRVRMAALGCAGPAKLVAQVVIVDLRQWRPTGPDRRVT